MMNDLDRNAVRQRFATEAGESLVLPLNAIGGGQRASVGGKATSLAALVRAGLPVPEGFCVTAAAYRQHLAVIPRWPELAGLLAQLPSFGADRVARVSREVCAGLAGAPMPAAVAQAIGAAWRELGAQGTYAVRSSATVEDAADHSFAGMFDSRLEVRGEDALRRAVQSCWHSLFSERALAYFLKHQVPLEQTAMAVVVQRMVSAEHAGVIFTADPLTGDARRCVVEYVAGLGEALVSGHVRPERLLIEKKTGRLATGAVPMDKTGGSQESDLVLDPRPRPRKSPEGEAGDKDEGRGRGRMAAGDRLARMFHTQSTGSGDPAYRNRALPRVGRVPLPGGVSPFPPGCEISGLARNRVDERRASKGQPAARLSESARRRLWTLACQAERLMGGPQDIEWAQRDGEIFLLQARPITVRPTPPSEPPVIWSNLNVAENFPKVATPMSWSLLDYCLNRFFAPIFKCVGIDPQRTPWVGWVAGRVYMNVGTLYRLMRGLPGFRQAHIGRTFGGFQETLAGPMQALLREPPPGLRERGRLAWQFARLAGWFLRRATWRSGDVCAARFTRLVNEVTNVAPGSLPDAEFVPHLNRLWDELYARVPVTFTLGAGIGFNVALEWCCARWFDDPQGAVANRLVSRAGGMASAASAVDLWRLAAWVAGQESVQRAVAAAGSFSALAARLHSIEGGQMFLRRWQEFMATHGHHAGGELDVATPRWSETPDTVLGLLQHYLASRAELDLDEVLAERTREREEALAACCRQLRNPVKRQLLGWMVRGAQSWLIIRENLKCEFIRVLAHVREVLLELGRRLTRTGVLEQADDIFFLMLDELEAVIAGTVTWDVRTKVKERRAAHEKHQALQPPPVVVGDFDPDVHGRAPVDRHAKVFHGLPVSPGVVTGPARVILDANRGERVLPGEILVAPATDPGWTPLFLTAAGVVVDLGGQLSHGSVIAREYGLPAVVNVQFATQVIRTGQRLRVDANRGVVTVLD